jgi:hypothetical protein
MPHARKLLFVVLALTLTFTAHAQGPKSAPQTVKLKRGQTLSLSLMTPIDSGHAKLGDEVTMKLARPLVADGATVLPVEWVVHGRITKVKRAGKNCKDGQVAWKIDPITTPGGDQLRVQEVHSYPFKYVVSGDPVWVPLDTPLTKIGGAAEVGVAIPAAVALSPLFVLMALATSDGPGCAGVVGSEKSLPVGHRDLFAVSKDVRVRPIQ